MMRRILPLLLASALAAGSFAVQANDDPLPRRPVLGAQLVNMTAEQRAAAKAPEGQGVQIGNVPPGLSAEKSGLRTGDVLLTVAGKPVVTPADIVNWMPSQKSGAQVPITFLRDGKTMTGTLTLVERPRDPGNAKYEVIYTHVRSSVGSNGNGRMRVIISKPKGVSGKLPAFMVIQGLGKFSQDVPLSQDGLYNFILRHFAENGFVTVRVDKPGEGDSEGGPYSETDLKEETDIYRQTLKMIKTLDYVDANDIFVFGHSMGGIIGPPIVAEEPVRGFIVGGTGFKTWLEYWLENTRRQAVLGGMSYAEVDQYVRGQAIVTQMLLMDRREASAIKSMYPQYAAAVDEISPDGKTLQGRTLDFWSQLANENFASNWSKVKVRTLAIWSENDFISTKEDHEMIANAVNKNQPGFGEWMVLPRSDHGFYETSSFLDSTQKFGRPGSKLNLNIIEELDRWIKKVRGKSRNRITSSDALRC